MRRRVVYLVTGLSRGGAEMQLLHLAVGMKKRGWNPMVISLTGRGPLANQFDIARIPVHSMGMQKGWPNLFGLIQLTLLLRKYQPQIVHCHMYHANMLGRLSKLLAPKPRRVTTLHTIQEERTSREWGYRLTNILDDLTTAVSVTAARRYIAEGIIPKNKMRPVPNGIDVEEHRGPITEADRERIRNELEVSDEFLWLAVGRVELPKDYPNMLSAFASLKQRVGPTALAIAGAGSLQERMRDLASSLGVSSNVRFLGHRHDVNSLFQAADAFVLSSRREGLPLVLLEASAAGLPVVATDVGGNHEIVREARTGYLVPPEDAEALAVAMIRIQELPEITRREFGNRGRRYVAEHYGLESVLDIWESIYSELGATEPPSAHTSC